MDQIYEVQHNSVMDQIFKDNYVSTAYARIDKIEPMWQRQIHDMHLLWKDVDKLMDYDGFTKWFVNDCKYKDLPYETYDIEGAFVKAQNEWAIELMLDLADTILCVLNDNAPQDIFWHDGHICLDNTLCLSYRDWVVDHYLR